MLTVRSLPCMKPSLCHSISAQFTQAEVGGRPGELRGPV